ncbi:retrovirus-related pol polyprotein from transposon TNT 1-94 [Tanacetum coccineum]
MLVIAGLRDDYNGLKSTLLARQAPTAFHELKELPAYHDYMIKQFVPVIPSPQAFTTTTSGTSSQTGSSQQDLVHKPSTLLIPKTAVAVVAPPTTVGVVVVKTIGPTEDSSIGHPIIIQFTKHATDVALSPAWLFDTSSNSHVAPDSSSIGTSEPYYGKDFLHVGNDWGGEFQNLPNFFSPHGIIHRRSCPHTKQNGFVERRHRHVVETRLALLAQSGVPSCFWHFAYDTVVYLINRMPSRIVPSHHGYMCLDPTSDRMHIAPRHVRFIEHQFPFLQTPSIPPSPPP